MQTTSARPVGRAAAALAELVRFRTVSSRTASEVGAAEFEGFIAALPRLYPAVHAALDLERVNGQALLYRWRGAGPDPAARQSVLMAHYDVVPAGGSGRVDPAAVFRAQRRHPPVGPRNPR